MESVRAILFRKLRAIWQRRWIAVATAWVLCLAGWYGVMQIPNQYEASARLYVDADAVLTPLLRGISIDSSVSNELDILQRTLLSRPNLEKLIAKTDLELSLTGPSDLERLVASLATEIRLVPQTRNLFTITYRNTSPKIAFDVVQNVLTSFIESKVGNNRSDMENADTFLQAQIDNYEHQLREAERKRAEFRVKYIDLLPGDNGGVSRMEGAEAHVRQLQGQLEDANARHAALAKELETTPSLVVTETNPGTTGGGGGPSRLQEAERHLAELRLRYTDSHPEVVAQRNMIEALRSGALSSSDAPPSGAPRIGPTGPSSRSVPNPVYEQLKVRLVEGDALIASLNRQLNEATKEHNRYSDIARGAPGLQAEYININRDYDVIRRNYDELLVRREQMRIAEAADANANKVQVQIVDPPQKPQTPVAPKRGVLVSAVLGAGLAAGIALTLMLSEIDTSFQGIDDLRTLGLPVIGGISIIQGTIPLWRRIFRVASVSVMVLLLFAAYGGLAYRLAAAGAA